MDNKHHHLHTGDPVRVGPYTVLAGGNRDLTPENLALANILVPLTLYFPRLTFGQQYQIIAAPMEDFGGVPQGWKEFLKTEIVPVLEDKKLLLVFCGASHGRTGTFLASLIALLESKKDTPDPIEAVRQRHCRDAVETYEQAEGIFAVRGEHMPKKYRLEFRKERLKCEAIALKETRRGTNRLR